MKRITQWALLALTVLSLSASVAHAAWSPAFDIPWRRQNYSNTGGAAINRPDTSWTTIAASKVDTSAAFNVLDSDMPFVHQIGGVAADSLPFAYVTVYGDSGVTNTVNFKATTVAVQVNWSTSAIGWTTVKTYTCTQTDGTKFWPIPLFGDGVVANADANALGIDGIQLNWQFAPALRIIVTGGATASVPAARIRIIKFRANRNVSTD